MGKTLKDLFESAEIAKSNFYTLETSPANTGKTMKERYDVRNSKEIKVSSSAPLMGVPFLALNKIRLADNERTRETFLEEELVGLRTLRGISSPIIYGSDILRLKLESTPMVEKMKNSVSDSASPTSGNNLLSKFGQQIQQTRDSVNKFLQIPIPQNPTEYYKQFDTTTRPVYDRMIQIGEIKKSAAGSAFGNIMKQSAGGAAAAGKQVLGNALAQGKKALRNSIIGSNLQSQNGSNNFKRYEYDTAGKQNEVILYSQVEGENYSTQTLSFPKTGQANADVDYNQLSIKNRYDGVSSSNPKFPLITSTDGTGWNSKTWYIGKFENPVSNDPFEKINGLSVQRFFSNSPYTKNTSSDGKLNTASEIFETQNYSNAKLKNDSIVTKPGGGKQKTIDVNLLRPGILSKKQNGDAAVPSYSKQKELNSTESVYGQLSETLEKKRGLGSNRDVLNQTGVLTAGELNSIKYNDDTLDKLDLIPLRFQRANDNTAIYMRTTLKSFSETFTPSWEASKFIGNPFNFYSYTGIERKVSFGLKVYAMSQVELVMMWRRLEYLTRFNYPFNYSSAGVEPTILFFTLGSLYVDKAAIITSLTYGIEDNQQLWELGGGNVKVKQDQYVESFNKRFNTGATNETKLEIDKFGIPYPSVPQLFDVDQTSGESKPVDMSTTKTYKEIFSQEGNIEMDKYKLPKFIDVQLEMTFLESFNGSRKNLYDYGKPITSGR